jgi:hypothetical protein
MPLAQVLTLGADGTLAVPDLEPVLEVPGAASR